MPRYKTNLYLTPRMAGETVKQIASIITQLGFKGTIQVQESDLHIKYHKAIEHLRMIEKAEFKNGDKMVDVMTIRSFACNTLVELHELETTETGQDT